MNLRKAGLLLAAFGSIAQMPLSHAASKVDAIQLDYIALDDSVKCNREFFGSSQRFLSTIFMAPKVMPGTNPDGKRSYSFIPKGPNKWDLHLRFIFPNNEKAGRLRGASSQTGNLDECNLDRVRESLNKSITDGRPKIKTVSKMPISSIEVRIPGFRNTGRVYEIEEDDNKDENKKDKNTIGKPGADILSYKGVNAITVNLEVNDQEKDAFYAQIVDDEGLPLRIKLIFQAQSRDGSASASIDSSALQAAFSAAVGHQTALTALDVKLGLQKSVTTEKISITSVASSSAEANKIIEGIIKKAVDQMNMEVEKTIASKLKTDGKDKGKIELSTVLEIISNTASKGVDYNNIVNLEASAQFERRLKVTSLRDHNIREIPVHADWSSPSMGAYMKAGMSMKINAAHWKIEKLSYEEVKTYLTESDLAELDKYALKILTDRNVRIENETINGFTLAIGKMEVSPLWSFGGVVPMTGEYRFVRIRKEAVRSQIESGQIGESREDMAALPVGLSFSNVSASRPISLAKILSVPENHPFLGVAFDDITGTLTLTAKQDLGIVHFRELMSAANSNEVIYETKKPEILEKIVVEQHFGRTIKETEEHEVSRDNRPIVQQKVITFHVTYPEQNSAPAAAAAAKATSIAPLKID